MKKILFLFAICTVCGCERPQVKDKQTVSSGENNNVKEVEIKGHIYLIFNEYNKGNIIHAEHCPCKTSK